MICPHCKKAIDRRSVTETAKRLIRQYSKEGFSCREIERILFAKDNIQVSFASVSRVLKKHKPQ